MKSVLYLTAILALALLPLGQITAQTACYSSCDNWGSAVIGGYWIGNDFWNNQGGSQCIYANSKDNWWITSNQPAGDGNVKAYGHVGLDIGKVKATNISQFSSITSSVSFQVPGTGYYDASYDLWVPTEIMIWLVNQGNVNPIAESYDASGHAIASVSNLTLGGHTWNVYHRSGSTISFVRTSNTTSATVDILALINWAKNTKGWIGDGNVADVEFGFEVFNTNGATSTFKCTGFSVNFSASNWSGGGSVGTGTNTISCGGSTVTNPPSVTNPPTATNPPSGGNCGTCNWYGTNYPMCCTTASGWGWENSQSCISQSTCNSQNGGSSTNPPVTTAAPTTTPSGGNCGTCNWYGTNYPMCCTTASGWGWENSKSCISQSTCNSQ